MIMQNLPIFSSPPPPVHSSQATPSAENSNAPQATEPFGNVLARQRTHAAEAHAANKPDSKQQKLSPANESSANIPTQEAAPDATLTLPADKLSTAITTLTTSTTITDKTDAKSDSSPVPPVPGDVSTLPGDMLAMLQSPVVAASNTAKDNTLQGAITDEGKKAVLPQVATPDLGPAAPSAEKQAAVGAVQVQGGTSTLLRAQGNAKPDAASTEIDPLKDNTLAATPLTANTSALKEAKITAPPLKDRAFSAALDVAGKDSAKVALADIGLSKIKMQHGAAPAVDIPPQAGGAPLVTSQSGATQAVRTTINTPVAQKGWGDEFSQKITWMATSNDQSAELHLNPPNLGPLDVVLKVSGDQATALFTSPHAAVRDAIEQALPQLRDMLAGNGITLGNATVSDQSAKDQQAWQADQRQKGNGRADSKIDSTLAAGAALARPVGRQHQGMVDTFA
jgi:flagellar hook-length control protein FliK